MKVCAETRSMWFAVVLLYSACMGCAWVSYSEPDSLPGPEPILTEAKRPIRLQVSASTPPGMSPALLDGFKKGASALEPYYWMLPVHRSFLTRGNEKLVLCRLDVSKNSSLGWPRSFLYGITFFLFPYEERREYTLALKLFVDDSEVKTATYVVKERYYKWLFAVKAPSSLTDEWMPADDERDVNRSPELVQRLGVILGKTTAAFCRDRAILAS